MKLRIDQLCVRVADQADPILDIPALTLDHAAMLGVSGASGSGKTTLFNQLCGLSRGNSGSLYWNETDLYALSSAARDRFRGAHIGVIMQDFHLIAGLSAVENVILPSALRHFRGQRENCKRGKELLAQLGLFHPERKIERHSRGEKQRIAIARALFAEPEILLADEPTASLDGETAAMITDLLCSLAKARGCTLIAMSHDRQLLNALDQHLHLAHGRIASFHGDAS